MEKPNIEKTVNLKLNKIVFFPPWLALAAMVAVSGARSTDLEQPEDAAALCAKTHAVADRWEPVADALWDEGHWTSGPNKGRRK